MPIVVVVWYRVVVGSDVLVVGGLVGPASVSVKSENYYLCSEKSK